jgi:hypothetical protein
LVDFVCRDHLAGIGKPEPLRREFAGRLSTGKGSGRERLPISGSARRCAEKLRFSGDSKKIRAATPPDLNLISRRLVKSGHSQLPSPVVENLSTETPETSSEAAAQPRRSQATRKSGTAAVWNKCPTNFSLSPSFDKLKLVGHQTASLPEKELFRTSNGEALRHSW